MGRAKLRAGGVAAVFLMYGAIPAAAENECLKKIVFKTGAIADQDPAVRACLARLTGNPVATDKTKAMNPASHASAAQGPKPRSAPPPLAQSLGSFAQAQSGLKIVPLLRHDFSDLWLFSNPDPVDAATGATISYSADRIADNDNWTAHGMAALAVSYLTGSTDGLIGISAAPYVAIDHSKNSNTSLASSNVDVRTVGGTAEIGVGSGLMQNYFRLRGANVSDQIARTSTASTVLEWIPVYRPLSIGSPTAIPLAWPIVVRFNPELIARYDALPVPASTTVKNYYWRYGPQATLVYQFLSDEVVPGFLRRLNGQTTYSWLHADDGRDYPWFSTSLTYNIDDAGHVGLTASYQKGRVEDTGTKTDIFTVGLSAKW